MSTGKMKNEIEELRESLEELKKQHTIERQLYREELAAAKNGPMRYKEGDSVVVLWPRISGKVVKVLVKTRVYRIQTADGHESKWDESRLCPTRLKGLLEAQARVRAAAQRDALDYRVRILEHEIAIKEELEASALYKKEGGKQ